MPVASHECLGLYYQRGAVSNNPWNRGVQPKFLELRVHHRRDGKLKFVEMMEVEGSLLLGFAGTFAGLWRYDGSREAVPHVQPPLQQNRNHLLYLGIAMQPSRKASKAGFQSIWESPNPFLFWLWEFTESSNMLNLPGWDDHHRRVWSPEQILVIPSMKSLSLTRQWLSIRTCHRIIERLKFSSESWSVRRPSYF